MKQIWLHLRKYKLEFFFGLFAISIVEIIEIFVPIFYKKFFDILTGDLPVSKDQLVVALVGVIASVLLIHAISWLLWRTINFVHNWLIPRVMADFNQSAHSSVLKHSYGFFLDNFAGSLIRKVGRAGSACVELNDLFQYVFLPLCFTIIGDLIVLYSRHYMLALVLFVWTIIFIVVNIWISLWKYKYDIAYVEVDSESTGVLSDSITNAVSVKLFTGISYERALYKEVTDRQRKLQSFRWNLGEIIDAVQYGLMIIIEFILMYLAISYWKKGILTVGDFALIQGYLIALFGRLNNIGKAIRHFYESLADASEIVQIMESHPEVVDAKQAKPLVVSEGSIEFQEVSFNFHKTRRVLNKLNFSIKPGEKVAFVGPSGAGKSTITKLLLRLYDIDRGKILIDEQNIAKVTQESLRRNIAVVPQEPVLFHRTVLENIRYGRQGATDEEVFEAAKKARCHDFISELQDGYNTFVGERGVKLSGGERQRVAIARAILKNAPIFMLDEATSSLDSESEALIQEGLNTLMKGKTTIVIAHRLSTIMNMDRIIVVEDGKVVDTGTHRQLLRRRGGTYKRLWEIQTCEYLN